MTTTESTRAGHVSLRERLGVLDTTAITFTKTRATQAAASLAYYTFFSIFPLMLLLILAGSFFLDRQSVMQRVTQAVQSALPVSQSFIVDNLQQVLKQRTAVGIVVLVSLLWSASNLFTNLAMDVNEAWPEAKGRNFVRGRLIGVNMIFGLTVLLILSVGLDALAKWLGSGAVGGVTVAGWNVWALVTNLISWVAVFLLFLAMYRWVPTVSVRWAASAWGALAAAVGWKVATTAFSWYLASPFAQYEKVYGSLGAIVAFLFMIYIIAMITLFGAHLTAAIDHLQKKAHAARAAADGTEGEPAASPVAAPAAVPVTGTEPPAGDASEEAPSLDEQKQSD